MRQEKYDVDPIAAEKIRKALEAPVEEREAIDLPKPKPPEQCERWALKPTPPKYKKKGW